MIKKFLCYLFGHASMVIDRINGRFVVLCERCRELSPEDQ